MRVDCWNRRFFHVSSFASRLRPSWSKISSSLPSDAAMAPFFSTSVQLQHRTLLRTPGPEKKCYLCYFCPLLEWFALPLEASLLSFSRVPDPVDSGFVCFSTSSASSSLVLTFFIFCMWTCVCVAIVRRGFSSGNTDFLERIGNIYHCGYDARFPSKVHISPWDG